MCKSPANNVEIVCQGQNKECIDGWCCNNPCKDSKGNKSCCTKEFCINGNICCDQNCLDKDGKCCTEKCIDGKCCETSQVCLDYNGNEVCCDKECLNNTNIQNICCKTEDTCKDTSGNNICCYLNDSKCIKDNCCPKNKQCDNKTTKKTDCCDSSSCSTEEGCCQYEICPSSDGKKSNCCKQHETCYQNTCVKNSTLQNCTVGGVKTSLTCDLSKEQCIEGNKSCCPNDNVCLVPGKNIKTCCNKPNESCVGSDNNKVCANDQNKKCDKNGENCIYCSNSSAININGVCCSSPCYDSSGKSVCCDQPGTTCIRDFNNPTRSKNLCCKSGDAYTTISGEKECCTGDLCKDMKTGAQTCCRKEGWKCDDGYCKEICGTELCDRGQACLIDKTHGDSCYNINCQFSPINYTPSNINDLEACVLDNDTNFVSIANNPSDFGGPMSRSTNKMSAQAGTCNSTNCRKRNQETDVSKVIFDETNKTCQAEFDCSKLPIVTYFNNKPPLGYEKSACMDGSTFTGVLCADNSKMCVKNAEVYNCINGWKINGNYCEETNETGNDVFTDLNICNLTIEKRNAATSNNCIYGTGLTNRTCETCISGYSFQNTNKAKCCKNIPRCALNGYDQNCNCATTCDYTWGEWGTCSNGTQSRSAQFNSLPAGQSCSPDLLPPAQSRICCNPGGTDCNSPFACKNGWCLCTNPRPLSIPAGWKNPSEPLASSNIFFGNDFCMWLFSKPDNELFHILANLQFTFLMSGNGNATIASAPEVAQHQLTSLNINTLYSNYTCPNWPGCNWGALNGTFNDRGGAGGILGCKITNPSTQFKASGTGVDGTPSNTYVLREPGYSNVNYFSMWSMLYIGGQGWQRVWIPEGFVCYIGISMPSISETLWSQYKATCS
jgi:hypothetical protein